MASILFTRPSDEDRAAALAHVALAEKKAAEIPGLPQGSALRPVARAAIIGAGTMGRGIAIAFADIGIPVILVDSDPEALGRAMKAAAGTYRSAAEKGRITADEAQARLARITTETSLGAIVEADIVIEAVFEDMAIKKGLFSEIDRVARPGAILATNTSGLDIDEIAAVTGRPGDVVGAHFFSPANVMRLLEVVRGKRSDPDAVATLMNLGRRMGKVSVHARVYPGFIGNAMLAAYLREAVFMVEEGATPREVDTALTEFGFAMGLFAVSDMAGNDVGAREARRMIPERDPALRYPDLLLELFDRGRHGQKTGLGWYRYVPGERVSQEDPELLSIAEAYAAERGISRRTIGRQEILERCLYGIINEAVKLVGEGVALRPSDVDVAFVTGYGFPAWRGGPLYLADRIGLDRVLAALQRFEVELGPWWKPAPLLERLVAEGRSISDAPGSAAAA